MAQRDYSINLRDSVFPMLSEQKGITTIADDPKNVGGEKLSPGIAYCHNVMPSAYGLDSVGYKSSVPAISPSVSDLLDTRVVYGNAASRLHLAWTSTGEVYSLGSGIPTWRTVPATVPATVSATFSIEDVTIGTVNGVSYIFYAGIGAFIYNEATNTLDSVTLSGVALASTLGIVAASGYLIAYTTRAIAWSSTIDPTDFVPSAVTGAGGGNVAGIGGKILFVLPNPLGVIIYTATNAIAGTYTGNVQYPFKFRPIDDAKGGISQDLVAYEGDMAKQYVYSKAGIQSLTSQRAETLLPDLTDFLAGSRVEDYDEVTGILSTTDVVTTLLKKVKYVASRYLIISYGVSAFTHAFIYDLALQRLGKIKLTHTDCFEYTAEQTEVAKESIAFLLPTGEVQTLDFSTPGASSGVLILGRIQAGYNRMLTLHEISIENVGSTATLSAATRTSLDGKNLSLIVAGTLTTSADNLRVYKLKTTAITHSILLQGKFNLTEVNIRYVIAGRVRR